MSDVRLSLTLTDGVSAALAAMAGAAGQAAAAEESLRAALAQTGAASAATAAAITSTTTATRGASAAASELGADLERMKRRMEDLAAVNPVEKAVLGYRRAAAEVRAYAEATGDAATASRAMAGLDARLAAVISDRNAATKATTTATRGATEASAGFAQATQKVGISSGQAAAAVTNLRAQFVDLFTQISTGGSPITALIQQGPQIAEAMAQGGGAVRTLTGALSFLAGPIGVVAAAALAMGGALYYASQQAGEAEAKVRASAEAADAAAAAYGRLRDSQRLQTVQVAVAAGELDPSAVRTTQATLQAEAQYRDQINAARAKQIAQTTALATAERALATEYKRNGEIATATTAAMEERVRAARAGFEAAKGQVDGLTDRVAETAAGIVEWEDYSGRAAGAVGRVATAARDTGDRMVAVHASLAALVAQADAFAPPVVSAREELIKMGAVLDSIRAGGAALGIDVSGTVDRLQAEIERRDIALRLDAVGAYAAEAAAAIEEELQGVVERVNAELAIDDLIAQMGGFVRSTVDALTEAGARAVRQSTAGQAVSALAGGASGVMSAVGMAGPVGAMVAMGYDLITGIADGALMEIAKMPTEIARSLEVLGPQVSDAVVELVGSGIPALIESFPKMMDKVLMEAIPALAKVLLDPRTYREIAKSLVIAIVQAIGGVAEFIVRGAGEVWQRVSKGVSGLFSADRWREIGRSIAQAVRDFFGGAGKKVKKAAKSAGETVAEWWEEAFEGGTAYVPRTGVYMLHQGERVVNRAGVNAETARKAQPPARDAVRLDRITILDMDGTAREMRKYLGAKGRGGRLELT